MLPTLKGFRKEGQKWNQQSQCSADHSPEAKGKEAPNSSLSRQPDVGEPLLSSSKIFWGSPSQF